jgi:hypothetical protein
MQIDQILLTPRRNAFGISRTGLETMMIAAGAALLSLAYTGFTFGVSNNLFHLPIVAGLYNEPQYHDDAFIQSLRHFSSGVWMLLDGRLKDPAQAELGFVTLDYLSRLLSFLGFLCCASLLGIEGRKAKIVFCFLLCFASILRSYSFAGGGGLFLNYFTHSEIANGTTLLALFFCARRRFAAMLVALGATFFINAFMAVWLVLPLGLMTLKSLRDGTTDLRSVVRQSAVGLVPFLILAFPVSYALVTNPELGRASAFDFLTYLGQYFGDHFLVSALSAKDLASLAAVGVVGAVAFWRLGAVASDFRIAYVGVAVTYVLGMALPYVTHNPLFIELHLLRSGSNVHLLAALGVASLTTKWICFEEDSPLFLYGALVALSLCAGSLSFVFAIPLILSSFHLQRQKGSPIIRISGYVALAILAVIICPLLIWQNLATERELTKGFPEWVSLGRWASNATPPAATFLIPIELTTGEAELGGAMPMFEFLSHRLVWVDFRRGAAVLWAPSYYPTWQTRLREVAALHALADRINYARAKGIGYVIDACDPTGLEQAPVFRTERLCVFSVRSG